MGFSLACVDRGVKYHIEVRKKCSGLGVAVGEGAERFEDQAK